MSLLGDYTKEAWRRVGRMLFSDGYEELTEYDKHLIEQYDSPGRFPDGIVRRHAPGSMLPGRISYVEGFQNAGRPAFRAHAPSELVRKVNRAYFRLRQYHKIEAWFEDRGFDLEQPTISREDFEAALAKSSTHPTGKLTDEELRQLQPGFVKNYLAPYSADSAPRPTVTELRKKWSNAGHGARLRDELDGELERQAKNKGIVLKPGRQKKRAS